MLFPWGDQLVEGLMIHVFRLVAPYGRQVRSIVISSEPLRVLFSIISALRPLPRLAGLELLFPPRELQDSFYDLFRFDTDDPILDLSKESNCQELWLSNCSPKTLIFPSQISSLTLYFANPFITTREDLAILLKSQSCLIKMYLGFIVLGDSLLGSSYAAAFGGIRLQHLRVLQLRSDIVSILSLMAFLDIPHLSSHNITVHAFKSDTQKAMPSSVPPFKIRQPSSANTRTTREELDRSIRPPYSGYSSSWSRERQRPPQRRDIRVLFFLCPVGRRHEASTYLSSPAPYHLSASETFSSFTLEMEPGDDRSPFLESKEYAGDAGDSGVRPHRSFDCDDGEVAQLLTLMGGCMRIYTSSFPRSGLPTFELSRYITRPSMCHSTIPRRHQLNLQ